MNSRKNYIGIDPGDLEKLPQNFNFIRPVRHRNLFRLV